MLLIRPAQPDDAADFRHFFAELIAGADTMLVTPEEYAQRTVVEVAANFRRFAEHDNHRFLLALVDNKLGGFISVAGGAARKSWGCGYIVAGVAEAHRRQGIGLTLFATAEAWARQAGLWRLELTMMAHNDAGRALYRRAGFVEEGVKRGSLHCDGRVVDEVWMGKLLFDPLSI
ncbi:GNAT family N-acetyltransferase [Chitinimonas arctica]|uniref:GNAT family N-acetyltransferase n=1 Tax=Chitinimonas arctica TaxID=2594795 RepID=A0A516SCJ3_9NEIS|nr:GNAT family N-acetyltransferase [Chitinimonas arctica]QDQ25873.1 GNAT family N-acetyltransferase [Chitinimonas arctica]